ncbi:differentially expressed in FDCP 8 homolog B isoform X3 [Cherax quadricarinatus]|uniref:differentially expressed in FDCP 8 homolog B isoform X3 n=1 Tax=Cherax quadricarinatus TaxID=27406 RepID=UPI0023788074|nr:differentially expressed in FDCP 8 homolog B-like isoform X2 [Cherax quadricarinatus]
MSENAAWKVSDAANVCISSVVSGVSEVASNVTYGVGGVVHCVASGMGDVVYNVSSGVGDTVHNVTAGVKRLLTTPPVSCESAMDDEEECPGVLPATPRNSLLSPVPDNLHSDHSPGADFEIIEEEAAINDELGITEDHFFQPEDNLLYMNEESLERSIDKCKSLILQSEESTSRRRALVHKLIQLRLRLQEIHDAAEIASTGVIMCMSHQLQPQKPPLSRASKQYCDKCAQIIWGVIHVSYVCALCEYRCHGRCVDGIQRRCASVKVNEDATYILRICPEVGLSAQNYKCAECKRLITNKYNIITKSGRKLKSKENAWCEPRRCDYTGLYYCPACHWNSRMVLPARVIHNWDYDECVVSRQAKQFLLLMKNKSVLHLEKLNPHLFKFVEELISVKKLREDLLIMKQYLGTCRTAQESRMLRQLEARQHFVENAHMYSLQDLIDINSGALVEYLKKVHSSFSSHIKKECLVCQGKGYICEICDNNEIIFPFDNGVIVCNGCSATLHHLCYTRNTKCPKCARQEARRKQESDDK